MGKNLVFTALFFSLGACLSKSRPRSMEDPLQSVHFSCQWEAQPLQNIDLRNTSAESYLSSQIDEVVSRLPNRLGEKIKDELSFELVDDAASVCGTDANLNSLAGCIIPSPERMQILVDRAVILTNAGERNYNLLALIAAAVYPGYSDIVLTPNGIGHRRSPEEVALLDSFSLVSPSGIENPTTLTMFVKAFTTYFCQDDVLSRSKNEPIKTWLDSLDSFALKPRQRGSTPSSPNANAPQMAQAESHPTGDASSNEAPATQNFRQMIKNLLPSNWPQETKQHVDTAASFEAMLSAMSEDHKLNNEEQAKLTQTIKAKVLQTLEQRSLRGEATALERGIFIGYFNEQSWRVYVRNPYDEDSRPPLQRLRDDLLPEMAVHLYHQSMVRELHQLKTGENFSTVSWPFHGPPAWADLKGLVHRDRAISLINQYRSGLVQENSETAKSEILKLAALTEESFLQLLPLNFAEFKQILLAKGLDRLAALIPLESGIALFIGGTFGAGKSSLLTKYNINPEDALAADPIKITLATLGAVKGIRRASSNNVHHVSSEAAQLTQIALNQTFAKSYIYDGSLRDIGGIERALKSGKRVVVNFLLVPIEISLLRVLSRPIGGKDSVIDFGATVDVYRATLKSLQDLRGLSVSDQFRQQFRLVIFDTLSPTVVELSNELADQRHALYREGFQNFLIKNSKPTVRELLANPVIPPREREALANNATIQAYLDMTIDLAMNEHAAK